MLVSYFPCSPSSSNFSQINDTGWRRKTTLFSFLFRMDWDQNFHSFPQFGFTVLCSQGMFIYLDVELNRCEFQGNSFVALALTFSKKKKSRQVADGKCFHTLPNLFSHIFAPDWMIFITCRRNWIAASSKAKKFTTYFSISKRNQRSL